MSRQQAFEAIYAKQHDVPEESLVQYRHKSKDGYNLPGIASHYRTYCETLDSFDSDLSRLKSEIEDLRREITSLKPSPVRTDKTTIGYTGCIICGQYTDHGGLQCPNLALRYLSIDPPTKPVPPSPILMSIHGYPVDENGKYLERKDVKP